MLKNLFKRFFAEIATDIQNRAAKLYEKEGGDQEVDTPAPVRTYGMFRREVHAASLRSLEELIQKKVQFFFL